MDYNFKSKIPFCGDLYSAINREKETFGFNWTNPNDQAFTMANTNETYDYDLNFNQTSILFSNVLDAFKYTSALTINSFPYVGQMSSYLGGGYVYKMNNFNSSVILNELDYLESTNWIDRYSRAIFVEFSLYNPNINLFAYCFILFEILPTGNLVKTSFYSPVKLTNINEFKDLFSTEIILSLVFLLFVILFMSRQIKLIFKLRKEYFKHFYSYINLAIIGLAWAGFAFIFMKFYEMIKIFKDIKDSKSNNDIYINLQYVSSLNESLTIVLGLCAMLFTLRLFKIIGFNKNIKLFIFTLMLSLKEISFFLLLFTVYWLSFAQIMYLFLNNSSIHFATFLKTVESCFQIMLGKFSADEVFNGSKVFGPIIFIFYNIVIVMTMITMFISILMNYYALIKSKKDLGDEESQLYSYLRELISKYFFFIKSKSVDEEIRGDFLDNYKYLEIAIDKLEAKISKASLEIEII